MCPFVDMSHLWQTSKCTFVYIVLMKTCHAHIQAGTTNPVRLIKRSFEKEMNPSQSTSRVQLFPLFASLSAPACDEIISAGQEQAYSPEQAIYYQGDPCRQVFLLLMGSAKSTQITANGGEVILRLSGPGELLGEAAVGFTGERRSTAQAMQPTRAIRWDSTVFAALVRRSPILQQNLLNIIEKHLVEMEERFKEISTSHVGGRLSREISRLVTRVGEPANGGVRLTLSQEELAQMTGTTLFTVSRLLSQWKNQGIVSTGRQSLMVHNAKKLASLFAAD